MSILSGAADIFSQSLVKLTIQAWPDREANPPKMPVGAIDAMYNPASIKLTYGTEYVNNAAANDSTQCKRYVATHPGDLEFDLIFDATLPKNTKSVDDQLAKLRSLGFAVNKETGETPYLRVSWGKMAWNGKGYFAGRLASMEVMYTLFDRDGTPLRATATLHLQADESLQLQQSSQGITAPKLPSITLPDLSDIALAALLLAGGALAVTDLAMNNNLDSLLALIPGAALFAPVL